VPSSPVQQPAIDTPSPFGSNIEGESLVPSPARLKELPSPTVSIIEGISVRATNDDIESPMLKTTCVPSTGPRLIPLSLAPPLPRVHVSEIAHVAGLSLTQPISRLSLNPTRRTVPPTRPAITPFRPTTPPNMTSNRPVHGYVTFNTRVTASTARAP
jgi:hypothetical protein